MEDQIQGRATDQSTRSYFRSERFFVDSGGWFVMTREAKDLGPFSSKQTAEDGLTSYLRTEIGISTDAWDQPWMNR